jgi:hypothetical protein
MDKLESLKDRMAQQIQLPDPPGIPRQITYYDAELILAEATEIYDGIRPLFGRGTYIYNHHPYFRRFGTLEETDEHYQYLEGDEVAF